MTLFVDGNNVPFITNNNLFYSPSLPLVYSPIAIQFVPPYRITPNDSPSIALSVSPTRLNENTNTKFAFTFTRNGDITLPLTVNFSVGGTAEFNTDYTQSGAATFNNTSGTILFTANTPTSILFISPIDDTTSENNETVIITIQPGSGYAIATPSPVICTILNDDSIPPNVVTTKSDYYLHITPPASSRPGVFSHIREPFIIEIPADGLVKFELIPSDLFIPRGRYRVRYYRRGNSKPFDIQNWIVRSKPLFQSLTLLYSSSQIALPYFVWAVNSVSGVDSFIFEQNMLNIFSNSLILGQSTISVQYQPALTLDQLIEYNINTSNRY